MLSHAIHATAQVLRGDGRNPPSGKADGVGRSNCVRFRLPSVGRIGMSRDSESSLGATSGAVSEEQKVSAKIVVG